MEDEKKGPSNERLLKDIEKGGDLALKATKEALQRGGISKQHMCQALEKVKATVLNETEVKKTKDEVEEIIIEKFLDKESLETILREGSPKAKMKATEKYHAGNENISNDLLEEIIQRVPKYRSWAIDKLLKQNPTEDQLTLANEFAGKQKLDAILRIELKKDLSLKRAAEYIEDNQVAAKIVWKKLCEEGRQYQFSDEQMEDIIRFSEFLPAKIELGKKLLAKLEERLSLAREKPGLEPKGVDIFDLERLIEEIRKNIPEDKRRVPNTKKAGSKSPAVFL